MLGVGGCGGDTMRREGSHGCEHTLTSKHNWPVSVLNLEIASVSKQKDKGTHTHVSMAARRTPF